MLSPESFRMRASLIKGFLNVTENVENVIKGKKFTPEDRTATNDRKGNWRKQELWMAAKIVSQFNLYQEFSKETEKLGFAKMRDIFLSLAIEPNRPSILDDARAYIKNLTDYSCPKDTDLGAGPDKKISELLIRVKRTQIFKLRNDVVHKTGYRPKRDESEHAVKEARSVLFPLTRFIQRGPDDVVANVA